MPALTLIVNGQSRTFDRLTSPVDLQHLIDALDLKPDRIAVEHNDQIAPRSTWATVPISAGDRIEIVHFVGGGVGSCP